MGVKDRMPSCIYLDLIRTYTGDNHFRPTMLFYMKACAEWTNIAVHLAIDRGKVQYYAEKS